MAYKCKLVEKLLYPDVCRHWELKGLGQTEADSASQDAVASVTSSKLRANESLEDISNKSKKFMAMLVILGLILYGYKRF